MEFVNLSATVHGIQGVIDPAPYLDALGSIGPDLPLGAREFACDPAHYDFSSRRCVKDLRLGAVNLEPVGEGESDAEQQPAEVLLRHNCWKHDEDLTIRYVGLVSVSIELRAAQPYVGFDQVILDEVLPVDGGCRHEIAFHGGSLVIVASDLKAIWTPTAGTAQTPVDSSG